MSAKAPAPPPTETSGLASALVGGAPSSSAAAASWGGADAPQRAKAEAALWRWNAAMAALHGAQAVVVLGAALSVERLRAFKIPMVTTFTDWSRGFPMAAIQHRADMPFVAVTSGFAFLSAAAHLIVLARFQQYKDDLRRGRNVFRWFEYALSSSLMIGELARSARERGRGRARARERRGLRARSMRARAPCEQRARHASARHARARACMRAT